MALYRYGISELLLVLLLGLVSMPMPFSVPPLPEDPALLRAAPTDSIAYFSWFGRAPANPQSKNLTERLAAETQVRRLFVALAKAARETWEHEARDGAEFARECFNLMMLAVERPGCVFLSGIDLPPKPFSVRAGLVVHLGPRAALAVPSMRKLEPPFLDEAFGGSAGDVRPFAPLPGLRFRALPMPDDAPPISWGVVNGYLVVAVGKDMARQIAEGLQGGRGLMDHQRFKEVHGRVRVARPCFRSFVDLTQVLRLAQGAGGREVTAVLAALGLADLQAVLSETGLEGEGFVCRSALASKGRSGLLAMIDGPPLTAEDLAIIPGDATLATAVRLHPGRYYRNLIDLTGKIDPRAPAQWKKEVEEALEQMTGLDLHDDLLAHLGDTLTLWNSPKQGGLLFTGLTVALELKDAKAFATSFEKVMGSVREMSPPRKRGRWGRFGRGAYIETVPVPGGRPIYYLNTIGGDMPFAPAWCVTDTHLMFSLFPQMLKASIARGIKVEGSLAQHPKLQALQDAVGISYVDLPRMFDDLYPVLHVLGQLAVGELQRAGFDVQIDLLPTADSIRPHLAAEVTSLVVRDDGLLMRRQGTIPVADQVASLAAPMLGALPLWMMQMRAVRAALAAEAARAREERRRKQLEAKKRKKDKEKR